MEKTLLSREDLSKRWGVNIRTIIKYEQEGIITRNPNIPTPRYNLAEINKLEGIEFEKFSPLERRRLEKEVEEWKLKAEQAENALLRVNIIISEVVVNKKSRLTEIL